MKTQIKILKHENKTSKEGKDYTRFNTSQGWVSAFDTDIIEDLKKAEGRTASVELATSEDGKFKNIRKFYGIVAHGLEEKQEEEVGEDGLVSFEKPKVIKPEQLGKSVYQPTSMYVSYAKDIFCALLENIKPTTADFNVEMAKVAFRNVMNESIELVKQAHKAFE